MSNTGDGPPGNRDGQAARSTDCLVPSFSSANFFRHLPGNVSFDKPPGLEANRFAVEDRPFLELLIRADSEAPMSATTTSLLDHFPPMGIYEVLFSFLDSAGTYMGNPGTHPWAQGFPLTSQLPGGPELPGSVSFGPADLKYPPATGIDPLLEAIRDYYNHFYGTNITTDNVAVFAGGRPGIFATVSFLNQDAEVLIEETEYTPYYDLLHLVKRKHHIVPSYESNRFRPTLDDYKNLAERMDPGKIPFLIKSNPCNPTGVTWSGDELKDLVAYCSDPARGGIIDEAYEFFHDPEPISCMSFVENIDDTNLFVIGAATKGLQVPGMRTGWVVASKSNIEVFRNFSSIGMGGVARPSQIYVTDLLQTERVKHARDTVASFYTEQRNRYAEGLADLGIELFSGDGGFYHWGKQPYAAAQERILYRSGKNKELCTGCG